MKYALIAIENIAIPSETALHFASIVADGMAFGATWRTTFGAIIDLKRCIY